MGSPPRVPGALGFLLGKEKAMNARAAAVVLAAAFLSAAPAAGLAALAPYTQNFESLVQSNPAALSDDALGRRD